MTVGMKRAIHVVEKMAMPDPFYQQILDGLAGRLDPDVFEEAVADLLRDVFPSLVPIRGGTDFGMDGAIADGEGPAFPLTCTTSPDVIGNFRTSLGTYVASGGSRRKVVVATSQELSGTKRRNLDAAAGELGFEIVQVFTRAAFAHRLYRNNDWCRRLLGLTGRPSALSVVPATARPLLGDALVGREVDLDWLRNLAGDGLLVGQPGSGKTSVLHALTVDGWGLFVVDGNLEALANAIRAQQPSVLIVDDAHVQLDLLARLRQLRQELGHSYKIVASSWPGEAEQVASALNLVTSQSRDLELLTRDQIVEVVKSAGVKRPNRLIRRIVDQAEGRPGLAVTLANLCIRGDITSVVDGEALKRSLVNAFENLVGRRATQILAALSLGGDSGMSIVDVAHGLGIPAADVQHDVVRLAAGGVILEVDRRLSVRPDVLRFLLVRDVFYSGAFSLPAETLLDRTTDLTETTIVLVGTRGYGGNVPNRLLVDMLERADSEKAWSLYASLGSAEAEEVLRRHPGLAVPIARQTLRNAPDVIVPLLLDEAVGNDRAVISYVEHPLRLIDDWIKTESDVTGDPIAQRKNLLRIVKRWLHEGGDRAVGMQALGFVLQPNFEHAESDPGSGHTVTFSRALLPPEQITEIGGLWPEVRDLIELQGEGAWEEVLRIAHIWTYPEALVLTGEVPDNYRAAIIPVAQVILSDLVNMAQDRPGVIHRLQQYAEELEMILPVAIPSEFATLFPMPSTRDWRGDSAQYVEGVQQLANVWQHEEPNLVARAITSHDREARLAGINWPRGTVTVCRMLAATTSERLIWFRALREAGAHPELLEPFLNQAVQNREAGWEEAIRECLRVPDSRWLGVAQALMQESCIDLVSEALSQVEGCENVVEIMCLRGQVPVGNVAKLLQHSSTKLATSAAIGEWQADQQGTVRSELEADWKAAILRSDATNHWVVQILNNAPALAEEWLMLRLQGGDDTLPSTAECKGITSSLDQAARRRLIWSLPITCQMQRLAKALVADDLELYQEVLNDTRLKRFHLDTLQGMKSGNWRELAAAALDAGYPPELVADAVYGGSHSWSGSQSAYWQTWVDRFRLLAESEDDRLKRAAACGISNAKQRRDAALVQERQEAIRGDG